MTSITCPACAHTFTAGVTAATAPDPSVVDWFRTDPGWLGEISAEEAYLGYLRATADPPVSRQQFLDDLAYLGVDQTLDDDAVVLIRT